MKNVFLLCLCGALCTSPVLPAYSSSLGKVLDVTGVQNGRVPLTGSLNSNQPKSNPASSPAPQPQQPVEVSQDGGSLEVVSLSSLGNLNIVVVNEQGYPVYQQTVNATAGSRLNIGAQRWSRGKYTVMIANVRGESLEGVFDVD